MKCPLSCPLRIASSVCLSLVFALLSIEARAQDFRLPLVSAPPPMKFVPRSELTQLNAVSDARAHTRASLELAEARLLRAEQMTAGQQFDAASAELGIYQGLIEEAINFLNTARANGNKMRDTYKRFELSLRTHTARIEALRRVTPAEYKSNLNDIADFTCGVRTEALNGFFGDVMHESGCERIKRPSKEISDAPPAEASKKEQ